MSRVRWSLTVAPTAITFALGALLLGGATATAEPAPTCAGGCSAGDAPKEVTAPTHEETAFILEEIAAQELRMSESPIANGERGSGSMTAWAAAYRSAQRGFVTLMFARLAGPVRPSSYHPSASLTEVQE